MEIEQSHSGITLNQSAYIQNIPEITMTNNNDVARSNRNTNDAEKSEMRQLSGKLNWAANQSRPDIAYENCVIANSIKNSSLRDIVKINKAVRKVKSVDVCLNYPSSLDINSCTIVCFKDSSFANLPDGGSQGGYIILLIDKSGVYSIISWQSRRIRRQANSSLAAECITAVEGAEASIYVQTLFRSLMTSNVNFKPPILLYTDNKSLFDNVHSSTPCKNKRLQIEMGILREMLVKKELTHLKWIPDKLNIANPLTKSGASCSYLIDVINTGLHFNRDLAQFV